MKKVVINSCHGGFGCSREAYLEFRRRNHPEAAKEPDIGEPWPDDPNGDPRRECHSGSFLNEVSREDPLLVELIESWGSERVSGSLAELKVVAIPDDVRYEIEEYDGVEVVAEKHRTWP